MTRRGSARPSCAGQKRGRTPQSGVESGGGNPIGLVVAEDPLPQWAMPANPQAVACQRDTARAIEVVLFGRIDLASAASTADEDAIADTWATLAPRVQRVIEKHGGFLLPTAPGPVLAGFDNAPAAAGAAHELHQLCRTSDRGRASGQRVRLCIGLHAPTSTSKPLDPHLLGVDVVRNRDIDKTYFRSIE